MMAPQVGRDDPVARILPFGQLLEARFHTCHAAGDNPAAAGDQDLALEHDRLEQADALDAGGESFEFADRHQRDMRQGGVDRAPVVDFSWHRRPPALLVLKPGSGGPIF
jgi:hypothetical protein